MKTRTHDHPHSDAPTGRGRRGRPSGRQAHFHRAMQARRWMRENPSPTEVIAMLSEYQRDLEQEVADVADRIAELRRIAGAEEPGEEVTTEV